MLDGATINGWKERLAGVSSVLVVLPSQPSFDEVAAGLALRLGLLAKGKKVGVACEAPMVVAFNQLVGLDKVKDEIGGDNLVIVFDKAASEAVERISWDMEAGSERIKLVVYPKVGKTAPNRSQISFGREGASGELVVAVGQNWGKLEGKLIKVAREKLVGISVGGARTEMFGFSISDGSRSAVSEVVTELLSGWEVVWDEDLATNLFLGIEAGSKGFMAKQVSAETFRMAGELLAAGARRVSLPEGGEEAGGGDWMTPKVYKGGMLT